MHISPIDTDSARQASLFLTLPFRIYRNTSLWVPPLRADTRRMLNRRRHPFYKHSGA